MFFVSAKTLAIRYTHPHDTAKVRQNSLKLFFSVKSKS